MFVSFDSPFCATTTFNVKSTTIDVVQSERFLRTSASAAGSPPEGRLLITTLVRARPGHFRTADHTPRACNPRHLVTMLAPPHGFLLRLKEIPCRAHCEVRYGETDHPKRDMDPGRRQQIERLYHSALQQDQARRDRFLTDACREDTDLRREDRVGSNLARPHAYNIRTSAGITR